MFNGTATDAQLTVYAICGHKPAGYTIVLSGTALPAGSALDGGVTCPAGTSVLGGGAQATDHVPAVQIGGSINQAAFSWITEVNNTGQSVAQVDSYGICAA
jgi:hypothetical protein